MARHEYESAGGGRRRGRSLCNPGADAVAPAERVGQSGAGLFRMDPVLADDLRRHVAVPTIRDSEQSRSLLV